MSGAGSQVFFATNREPLGRSEEMGEDFGSGYVDRLQFGVAQIPCPEGRPLVQRELQWAGTMAEADFKAALRDSVRRDPQRAVLLYVHGCFSDFGRSMGYGAQILVPILSPLAFLTPSGDWTLRLGSGTGAAAGAGLSGPHLCVQLAHRGASIRAGGAGGDQHVQTR